MLGTINPQIVAIDQQVVAYPGRDHVCILTVKRFDGRTYKPVDMTAVTRVILSFPEADPVIVYDSSVQAVFTHVGSTLTVDLSDYAMPASVLGCQIILYDVEHPAGQVLVDDIDAVVQFDFRNVSATGGTPPPAAEYLTDAPVDGATYARKDGLWVPVDSLVSGVASVNGMSGVVVLDAADVGADPVGAGATAASAAVAAHTALADPHPEYLTPAEADTAYAPSAHVGAGGAAHSNAVAAGVAGFMTGADKTKLDGVAAGATANANTDSLSEGSTNKYFTELRVLATLMTGLTLIAGGAVSAADSLLVAIGKLQKQVNDLFSGKQDTLVSATNIKTVNGSSLLGSGDLTVSGGASLPVVQTFTGAKVLGLADINTYNVSQDATAQAVALPAQATVAWTADAEIHIERGAAGAVTIVGAVGVQINEAVAGTFTLGAQYSVVTLKRKAPNLWTLFGNAA